MEFSAIILIIFNLSCGIVLGLLMARRLSTLFSVERDARRIFKILIFIYLVECAAVALSMGTSILSIGLAFVWGVIGGFWLRKSVRASRLPESVFISASYTCVPVISLALIPLMSWIGGWDVLSAERGYAFGIPDFLRLPWPANTILGFYLLMVVASVVLKLFVTVIEVFIIYHAGRDEDDRILARTMPDDRDT